MLNDLINIIFCRTFARECVIFVMSEVAWSMFSFVYMNRNSFLKILTRNILGQWQIFGYTIESTIQFYSLKFIYYKSVYLA